MRYSSNVYVKHYLQSIIQNVYKCVSDQYFNAVLLLHALQLSLDVLLLLLHASQTLQQLLVCNGEGLMAPNDGHNRGFRPVIKVTCKSLCRL